MFVLRFTRVRFSTGFMVNKECVIPIFSLSFFGETKIPMLIMTQFHEVKLVLVTPFPSQHCCWFSISATLKFPTTTWEWNGTIRWNYLIHLQFSQRNTPNTFNSRNGQENFTLAWICQRIANIQLVVYPLPNGAVCPKRVPWKLHQNFGKPFKSALQTSHEI